MYSITTKLKCDLDLSEKLLTEKLNIDSGKFLPKLNNTV